VSDTAQEESAVHLDPFEVKSTSHDGYLPAEVTTGTRYAANMLEIPFSVATITAEFIEDFPAHNFNEILAYTSGFAEDPGSQNGSFVQSSRHRLVSRRRLDRRNSGAIQRSQPLFRFTRCRFFPGRVSLRASSQGAGNFAIAGIEIYY